MPLISYEIEGHDPERLAFRFSMLNDNQVVLCQISDAALDELAGMKGTENSARVAQFLSLRQTIEQTASRLFDEKPILRGSVVKIFSRDLAGKPKEANQSQPGSE
ncbi:DUF1488 family protein [Bradyrhizobium sp.]|jgi:hypothetical protein|uniref:DUF1488 family protein n=1 Tax=Bradyrhizobium sp. TaxID=376 RepID=UPI003BB0A1A3